MNFPLLSDRLSGPKNQKKASRVCIRRPAKKTDGISKEEIRGSDIAGEASETTEFIDGRSVGPRPDNIPDFHTQDAASTSSSSHQDPPIPGPRPSVQPTHVQILVQAGPKIRQSIQAMHDQIPPIPGPHPSVQPTHVQILVQTGPKICQSVQAMHVQIHSRRGVQVKQPFSLRL